jgi:uncharacterized membrane protein YccC
VALARRFRQDQTRGKTGDAAPGEERRAQVGEALAALQAVRHAASARWTPGAGAQPGANLHARLLDLESALNALRVPEEGRL